MSLIYFYLKSLFGSGKNKIGIKNRKNNIRINFVKNFYYKKNKILKLKIIFKLFKLNYFYKNINNKKLKGLILRNKELKKKKFNFSDIDIFNLNLYDLRIKNSFNYYFKKSFLLINCFFYNDFNCFAFNNYNFKNIILKDYLMNNYLFGNFSLLNSNYNTNDILSFYKNLISENITYEMIRIKKFSIKVKELFFISLFNKFDLLYQKNIKTNLLTNFFEKNKKKLNIYYYNTRKLFSLKSKNFLNKDVYSKKIIGLRLYNYNYFFLLNFVKFNYKSIKYYKNLNLIKIYRNYFFKKDFNKFFFGFFKKINKKNPIYIKLNFFKILNPNLKYYNIYLKKMGFFLILENNNLNRFEFKNIYDMMLYGELTILRKILNFFIFSIVKNSYTLNLFIILKLVNFFYLNLLEKNILINNNFYFINLDSKKFQLSDYNLNETLYQKKLLFIQKIKKKFKKIFFSEKNLHLVRKNSFFFFKYNKVEFQYLYKFKKTEKFFFDYIYLLKIYISCYFYFLEQFYFFENQKMRFFLENYYFFYKLILKK